MYVCSRVRMFVVKKIICQFRSISLSRTHDFEIGQSDEPDVSTTKAGGVSANSVMRGSR